MEVGYCIWKRYSCNPWRRYWTYCFRYPIATANRINTIKEDSLIIQLCKLYVWDVEDYLVWEYMEMNDNMTVNFYVHVLFKTGSWYFRIIEFLMNNRKRFSSHAFLHKSATTIVRFEYLQNQILNECTHDATFDVQFPTFPIEKKIWFYAIPAIPMQSYKKQLKVDVSLFFSRIEEDQWWILGCRGFPNSSMRPEIFPIL